MIALNSSDTSLPISTGILIEKFITVKAAAEVSGYNVQYLRRLLRMEKLDSVKVGQVWLIKLDSLETYIQRIGNENDHRCGPKGAIHSKRPDCFHK